MAKKPKKQNRGLDLRPMPTARVDSAPAPRPDLLINDAEMHRMQSYGCEVYSAYLPKPTDKPRRMRVFYNTETRADFTGYWLGLSQQSPSVNNPGGKPAPRIQLSEATHVNSASVDLKDTGNLSASDRKLGGLIAGRLHKKGERLLLPAGRQFCLPPYAVLVDLDAKDSRDAVLYAPEPGILPSEPLWPAAIVHDVLFPRPLPFVTNWQAAPRRFRYYAPGGTTGTLTGHFGFEIPASVKNAPFYPVRRGLIPGSPAVFLSECAPLPDGDPYPEPGSPLRDPSGKPRTVFQRDGRGGKFVSLPTSLMKPEFIVQLSDDWVILDDVDSSVVYWPPTLFDADLQEFSANAKGLYENWPARLVESDHFPRNATFAGTEYFVALHTQGPPLTHTYPNCGYSGFEKESESGSAVLEGAEIDPHERVFRLSTRNQDGPLTFTDAEEYRQSFLSLFYNYPALSLQYVSVRKREIWRTAPAALSRALAQGTPQGNHSANTLTTFFKTIPTALELADLVLWEPDLATEAVGGPEHSIAESWMGKPFPARLLKDTPGPQFHLIKSGNYSMKTREAMQQWGLDLPCLLVGVLIVPLNLDTERTQETSVEWSTPDKIRGGDLGFYACFFFMPVSPTGKDGDVEDLTANEAYFRARWFFPVLCENAGAEPNTFAEDGVYNGAYAQVAAMLDFMTSPRMEVAPTLWDSAEGEEPEDSEPAGRLEDGKPTRKPRDPNAPRYLTLRRVEVPDDVLEALNISSVPRGPLTEAHFVKEHTRKVRYGPGRAFVREVPIKRYKAGQNLPLREGAEKAVEARETGQPAPRYLRVVR